MKKYAQRSTVEVLCFQIVCPCVLVCVCVKESVHALVNTKPLGRFEKITVGALRDVDSLDFEVKGQGRDHRK